MALMLALLAACSSSGGEESADATGPDTTPTTAQAQAQVLADPTPEVLARVDDLAGQLAIGDGSRLSVSAPDGTGTEVLEDAPGTVASQPTWSHSGGQLAWSRTSPVAVEVVVFDLASDQEVVSDLATTPAFYFQWSHDDDTLAFLRTDPSQAGLELGLVDPGSPPVRMGAASPLFVSWAPASPVLAAHVAQQQVLVLPSPFAAVATVEPAPVLSPSGPFTAPVWLDDATVLVASTGGLVRLDVATMVEIPVVDTGGAPVQFVLSPDRRRVAVHLPDRAGGVSPAALAQGDERAPDDEEEPGRGAAVPVVTGGLQVVDLDTGALTEVTRVAPVAFEWSPDSERLAWLEPGASSVVPRFRWNFWDGTASTPSVSYELSSAVQQQYLPFFEQYTQSVTGWAPDGSAFAFAGRPDGSRQDANGVWVQLVGVPGAPPVRVADGDTVVWSP